MDTKLSNSDHAILRSAQRNLSDDDIGFIVQYGKLERRAGGNFYQLRDKDLPDDMPANDRRRRLIGSTVLLTKHYVQVVTVYRNSKAFRKDRRKPKYDTRTNRSYFRFS